MQRFVHDDPVMNDKNTDMKPDTNKPSQCTISPQIAKNSNSSDPSNGSAAQQKIGRKRRRKLFSESVQLMHYPLWGDEVLAIHDGREIWIIESEVSRVLGLSESGRWRNDIPDDCRSKFDLPHFEGYTSEIELVSLMGLHIFANDGNELLDGDPQLGSTVSC